MSEFLPENYGKQTGIQVNSQSQQTFQPTDSDVSLMQKVLLTAALRPQQIPQEFMAQFIDAIQVSNLLIPVSQLVGFKQFAINAAPQIDAFETTTSATYGDLATAGPSLTGLPDGEYALIFGAQQKISLSGQISLMSVSINGAAASDGDAAFNSVTAERQATLRVVKKTLSAGNNSVVAKYKATGGTGTFQYRFLYALKSQNA